MLPAGTSFTTAMADAGGPANYYLSNASPLCSNAPCTYEDEINFFAGLIGVPSSTNTTAFDTDLASKDYPLANFPDQYLSASAPSSDEGLAQIFTDYQFACNTIDSEADLSAHVNVYAYEFDDPLAPPTTTTPALIQTPNDQYGFPTASEHGSELQYLFAFHYTSSLSADELQLQTSMLDYWGNFVTNLTPNKGVSVTAWPAFGTKDHVQRLVPGPSKPSSFTTFAKEHFCTVWEPIIAAE
jgi:carboxylesterase type B